MEQSKAVRIRTIILGVLLLLLPVIRGCDDISYGVPFPAAEKQLIEKRAIGDELVVHAYSGVKNTAPITIKVSKFSLGIYPVFLILNILAVGFGIFRFLKWYKNSPPDKQTAIGSGLTILLNFVCIYFVLLHIYGLYMFKLFDNSPVLFSIEMFFASPFFLACIFLGCAYQYGWITADIILALLFYKVFRIGHNLTKNSLNKNQPNAYDISKKLWKILIMFILFGSILLFFIIYAIKTGWK